MDAKEMMEKLDDLLAAAGGRYELLDDCPLAYEDDEIVEFALREQDDDETLCMILDSRIGLNEDFDPENDLSDLKIEIPEKMRAAMKEVSEAKQICILMGGQKTVLPAVCFHGEVRSFEDMMEYLCRSASLRISCTCAVDYEPDYFYDSDRHTSYVSGYTAKEKHLSFLCDLPEFDYFEFDKELLKKIGPVKGGGLLLDYEPETYIQEYEER